MDIKQKGFKMITLPPQAIVARFVKETDAETGAEVKLFRESCKLSQADVQNKLNEPAGMLSRIENGKAKATIVFLIKFHRACVALVNEKNEEVN